MCAVLSYEAEGTRMKTNQFLPPRVGVAILILSICLTASSVRYQGSSPSFCYGNLAAGFPLRFICDTDEL